MYTKRLIKLTAVSTALFSMLHGCANLPSHDGSFNTKYGIEKEPTPLSDAANQAEVQPEEDDFKPLIQTLNDPASVDSTLIENFDLIEYKPESSAALSGSELDEQKTTVQSNQTTTDSYPRDESHHHILGAGETLYSIASQFTGTSENWKLIADYNGIESPDVMSVGMEILIPLHLVVLESGQPDQSGAYALVSPSQSKLDKAEVVSEHALAQRDQQSADTLYDISTASEANSEVETTHFNTDPSYATDESLAIVNTVSHLPTADGESPISDSQDFVGNEEAAPIDSAEQKPRTFRDRLTNLATQIKSRIRKPGTTTPAVVTPELEGNGNQEDLQVRDPNESTTITVPVPVANTNALQLSEEQAETLVSPAKQTITSPATVTPEPSEWVKIEGDFTPKAVYKSAGYGSGLLMRVSPGTTLKLTRQTNEWYEVETSKGSGFVFHRDALIVR